MKQPEIEFDVEAKAKEIVESLGKLTESFDDINKTNDIICERFDSILRNIIVRTSQELCCKWIDAFMKQYTAPFFLRWYWRRRQAKEWLKTMDFKKAVEDAFPDLFPKQ